MPIAQSIFFTRIFLHFWIDKGVRLQNRIFLYCMTWRWISKSGRLPSRGIRTADKSPKSWARSRDLLDDVRTIIEARQAFQLETLALHAGLTSNPDALPHSSHIGCVELEAMMHHCCCRSAVSVMLPSLPCVQHRNFSL